MIRLHALLLAVLLPSLLAPALARTVKLDWKVEYANYTRLCHTKPLVSVNGLYPGPTVKVTEGDTVVIKVTNLVPAPMTIHWHGVRQLRSAWADGPAFITQCPIKTGRSYVYKFRITQQRGTLFWHAHISWFRATVYGAFIIKPKRTEGYPFPKPAREITLIAGEWWNANPEDVIAQALDTGGPYNLSDAFTVNGQPGAFYNCSKEGTPTYSVRKGETILIRLINAAVNFDLFFTVPNHKLTVVEIDAEYTKPLTRDVVAVAAGQTTNVLLTADQAVGNYYMAFSVFNPAPIPIPETPTTAILSYVGASPSSNMELPVFPASKDIAFEANFTESLRSLTQVDFPVPQEVDEKLLFTVGYALQPCPPGHICLSPFGGRLSASISNFTFQTPNISILEAYYYNIQGVYEADFPDVPLFQYNYTGLDPANRRSEIATKVKVLEYNSAVQLVLQDTATLGFESHPIHLHGQNFYIVATGFGTFDPVADTPRFNLEDPPFRNTVAVPAGGWAALRFTADNPGIWYMHCHFDIHVEWGMSMAFLTKEGRRRDEKLPPPPKDFPRC